MSKNRKDLVVTVIPIDIKCCEYVSFSHFISIHFSHGVGFIYISQIITQLYYIPAAQLSLSIDFLLLEAQLLNADTIRVLEFITHTAELIGMFFILCIADYLIQTTFY